MLCYSNFCKLISSTPTLIHIASVSLHSPIRFHEITEVTLLVGELGYNDDYNNKKRSIMKSCKAVFYISTIISTFHASESQERRRAMFFSPEQQWRIQRHGVWQVG